MPNVRVNTVLTNVNMLQGPKRVPPDIQPYTARRLKTLDPRIVKKYNAILEELFDKHHVYERTLNLFQSLGDSLSAEQCEEYDQLDRLRIQLMKIAEKKCRKLHMGAVPWSPAIQNARDAIKYAKLIIRRRAGRKVGARTLIRLQKKLGYSYEKVATSQLGGLLDDAYKYYKALKKDATSLREAHLDSLAEALETAGKGKKAQIIRDLKQREEQRTTFRKLKIINPKHAENLSTTSVVLTLPSGERKEITGKVEMVKAIIAENLQKYHQSEDSCPFLQQPLRMHFGAYGETQETERVLQGKVNYSSSDNDLTPLFLGQCKTMNTPTEMVRTPQQFVDSWKRMRERTSSHDIHFGHFMAACEHRQNILVHYIMAEIPFRTGFAPTRWKSATNVMILKNQGSLTLRNYAPFVFFRLIITIITNFLVGR